MKLPADIVTDLHRASQQIDALSRALARAAASIKRMRGQYGSQADIPANLVDDCSRRLDGISRSLDNITNPP